MIAFFLFCRLQCFRPLGLWQFSCHGYKYLLHFIALLCWTLHIRQFFLFTKLVYFLHWYSPLVLHIRFISNQKEYGILLGIHLDLIHPKLDDTIKRYNISDIKYEKDALTTSVISACNCSKPLLTSGVPNLKFHILTIDLKSFESEVYTDSREIMLWELVLNESDEDSGFTYTGITYNNSLKEVVVLFDHFCSFIIKVLMIYCL